MAFRSDLDAAHARAAALEGKVAALEAENAELRGESDPETNDGDSEMREFRGAISKGMFASAVIGLGAALALHQASVPAGAAMVGILTVALLLVQGVFRELIQICPPGFVIVLSGRSTPGPDGSALGFRVVTSGRVLRVPILEVAHHLDCRTRSIECQVRNAYSKESVPLNVVASVVYRLSRDSPALYNAVERFLSRDMSEVDRVARETIEGNMRNVIASLSAAELQEHRVQVAEQLIEEIEHDFQKLGMEIDTLALTKISGLESG